MGKHSQFPWDLLKAECLRLVCSQLVQASNEALSSYPGGGRKEEMIEFLRDVETRTLDAAVEKLQIQTQNSPRKSVGTAGSPSVAKRTRTDEDTADDDDPEGYNTRYKGVKRVKVREEKSQTTKRTPRKSLNVSTGEDTPGKRGRGRPRKSIPEGTTTAPAVSDNAENAERKEGEANVAGVNEGETSKAGAKKVEISKPEVTQVAEPDNSEAQDEVATPKRGRGRPKKSDPKPTKPKATPKPKPTTPAVDDEGNPIKRGRGRPKKSVGDTALPSKGKEVFDGVHLQKRKTDGKDESGAADGNADGEGEEEDAVLAAVNGGGDGASSLGGSNKENDPDEAFRYAPEIQFPPDHDVDMDADGDPDAEADQAASAAPVAAA